MVPGPRVSSNRVVASINRLNPAAFDGKVQDSSDAGGTFEDSLGDEGSLFSLLAKPAPAQLAKKAVQPAPSHGKEANLLMLFAARSSGQGSGLFASDASGNDGALAPVADVQQGGGPPADAVALAVINEAMDEDAAADAMNQPQATPQMSGTKRSGDDSGKAAKRPRQETGTQTDEGITRARAA